MMNLQIMVFHSYVRLPEGGRVFKVWNSSSHCSTSLAAQVRWWQPCKLWAQSDNCPSIGWNPSGHSSASLKCLRLRRMNGEEGVKCLRSSSDVFFNQLWFLILVIIFDFWNAVWEIVGNFVLSSDAACDSGLSSHGVFYGILPYPKGIYFTNHFWKLLRHI
jgi:hypothetical protein